MADVAAGPWAKYGTGGGAASGPWAKYGGGDDITPSATVTAPQQPSVGLSMVNDFTGSIGGAWDQLKSDFLKGAGQSPEATPDSSAWDQAKDFYHQEIAAGKVPLDAFNLAISPVTGVLRAGVAKPLAYGMRGVMHHLLPGSEKMEREGKLPNQQQTEDEMMTALSAVMPDKGYAPPVVASGKPSTFSHIMSRGSRGLGVGPEDFATGYARRALKRDDVTKEQAIAHASKPDTSLSDLGKGSMVEAGEQAALSGEGRRLGSKLYFDERLKGREARTAQAVDNLVSDKNMYETVDALNEQRKSKAKPLYAEAFNGGSHAALKGQFENEFNDASKAAQKARKRVEDAENGITMASSKNFGTDNVYANSARNEEMRKAQSERIAAQHELDSAESDKEGALDRLREAQKHESLGIKGGVWSPRLQQFMDDPIVQQGIKQGMRTQQLEALGEGKAFNPHEYALTGDIDNETQLPRASKVPNLRALDAGKRGLDEILEGYRDKTSGKLVLDERGRAIETVRKGLVEELDKQTKDTNPAYKKAREAWGGPSRIIDAVHSGREFHTLDPEEISRRMKGMSEDETQGYRIGVSRSISDSITAGKGGNGALTTAKWIAQNTRMQKRLRTALGDKAADGLIEMAQREVEYAQRGSEILGGSQTARRNEGGKEFEQIAPVLDEVIAGARDGMTGIAASGKRQISRFATNWLVQKLRGLSQARRDALGQLLFSTNRDDNLRAIELLYEEGDVTMPGYPNKPTDQGFPKRKSVLPLSAAAGSNQYLNSQGQDVGPPGYVPPPAPGATAIGIGPQQ